MVLIFGGAYQGKLDIAKERFSLTYEDYFDCFEGMTDIDFSFSLINNFHLYILQLVKNDVDVTAHIEKILPLLADKTIIMNDISSGVVPLDKTLRKWREAVGRSMTILSENSDEVIRVYCGIATKLK